MLLAKCFELYHLVEEQHDNPSKELEDKIKELKEEIDRIMSDNEDSHWL